MGWLDIFYTYYTPKYVGIKHRKLALSYYLLLLISLLYVVGYLVVLDKGYLEYDFPVGILRPTLHRRFPIVNIANLPYCTAAKCRIWDHFDAPFPIYGEEKALSVSTQITLSPQQRVCSERATECVGKVFTSSGINETFFLAGIEDYNIYVEHTIQAPRFYEEGHHDSRYSRSYRQMKGALLDHEDNVLVYLNDSTIEDRFTLKQLLEAADVDLDVLSNFLGYEGETLRGTGLVLHVTLHYTNIPDTLMPTTQLPDIRYFYRVHQIMETPFEQQHYLNDNPKDTNYAERTLITRNGVHIKFVQSGVIGRFSFKTLLVNLLAATGLMSVAALACDFFAETILPFKKTFESIKYTYTEMKSTTPATTVTSSLKKRKPKKEK